MIKRITRIVATLAFTAGVAWAAVAYIAHPIMGTGTARDPIPKWYPASTNFGAVQESTLVTRAIRLKNVGANGLTGDIRIDPACNAAGVYSVASGGGPYTLAHYESRAVVIAFAPADTVAYPDCRVICTP